MCTPNWVGACQLIHKCNKFRFFPDTWEPEKNHKNGPELGVALSPEIGSRFAHSVIGFIVVRGRSFYF